MATGERVVEGEPLLNVGNAEKLNACTHRGGRNNAIPPHQKTIMFGGSLGVDRRSEAAQSTFFCPLFGRV